MKTNPFLLADFYKTSHRVQYPENTEIIFSNLIPRKSRYAGINKIVCFGIQKFVKEWLVKYFDDNFFNRNINYIVDEYSIFMLHTIGPNAIDTQHLRDLHELGYLPLWIRAIPEGERVSVGVPMLTIENTKPEFFWLTNHIETLVSCELWPMMTAATISDVYRRIFEKYAKETSDVDGFTMFQGHDFSMRGMSGVHSAVLTGMGHLTSFVGTNTIPAIIAMAEYYGADYRKMLSGKSVASVSCQGTNEHTLRLLTKVYPDDIVSKVSDTTDLWAFITEVLPKLKETILNRKGKLLVRLDSGDPVDILCGDKYADTEVEKKGVVALLWDIFGGTVNSKGYRELDPHIGTIYGDSVTIERCRVILQRLKDRGFSSTNVVLGIGSYNTHDTFGFAMESTYASVGLNFKDPVTDGGTKGLCIVQKDEDGEYFVTDQLNREQYIKQMPLCEMQTVFHDGKMENETTLAEIRGRLHV